MVYFGTERRSGGRSTRGVWGVIPRSSLDINYTDKCHTVRRQKAGDRHKLEVLPTWINMAFVKER